MNANLYATLAERAARTPDQVFLRVPDGPTLSYAAVFDRAARLAGVLHSAGVTPGARLVAQVAKSPDAVALYLAGLRIGAVVVPLNPAYTAEEMRFFVADAEPTVVVTDPTGPAPPVGPVHLTLGAAGDGTLADAARDQAPHASVAVRLADDLAAMLYTSGTTGRSKGAMLTHANLTTNALALARIWGWRTDDVLLHVLPVFHVHGLFVALHCALLGASEVVFCPRFDVDTVLEHLPRATVMMGVPTHYTRLLADPRLDADRCSGMRLFTSGSAPMTEATHRTFAERTGHRILERYGMTEAGMITSNPLDGERIPGTVGFPLPGVEVRVTGDGRVLAPGETGVVEVRGPNVFAGYWKLPDKTAAEFTADGWFVTGDVGHLDPDGRLTLEGRAGDMIISGGYNVYPKEVELALDEVPGVVESAVVGLPHPDLGEGVVAFVVADEAGFDPAVAAAHLDGRLARYKQPRHYEVVAELPRNAMGKVQKATLRSGPLTPFT